MRLDVTIGPGIQAYADRLRAAPAIGRRLMADGLNEGGDLQRTATRRELVEQMGVKRKGAVVKRTRSTRAGPGRLVYTIKGEGRGLPIQEFPVSVGAHVTAMPWRVRHDFGPRSFRTKVRGLLRRRVGEARMPIEAFNGPAVAKELTKDATAADFEGRAAGRIMPCVMKRLGRMLP